MRKAFFLALVAIVAGVLVAGLPAQRAQAPAVRFTLLSGEHVALSELRGKVVVVNFWATYCAPCIRGMPKLTQTHRKFAPRGHATIAVSVRRDDPGRVAEFAASEALPFPVALDSDGALAKEFGNVRVTPTTFVIGRDGRILKRYVGEPDWAELHAVLEPL